MELLLIRHALPVRRELVDGPADPELSESGHAQATHLAAYLSSERIDAIYASPLRRAVQTAEPVAAGQGLQLLIEDGVAEYDRLSNEYIPVEELKAAGDPRWKDIIEGRLPTDEFESPAAFQDHVCAAVERLVAAHKGQRIAVVCHGGVINAYLARIVHHPSPTGFFYPNYTSIHRVAAAGSGERSIVTVNETSHLRGTGLPIGMFQK